MADYDVFGLRIRSEIELPELFPAHGDGKADVTISLGAVPDAEEGAWPGTVDGSLLLAVADVARYAVTGGNSIVVDPLAGVPERNVKLFLLGSVFGALLIQRGLLPLHANAVEIGGRAVAFMGPSGEGKSTLAAWLHDRGHRIIADDVCVIGFGGDGRAYVAPGLPRLRLWADALERSGRETRNYERSYVGEAEEEEKFDVPLGEARTARSRLPLAGLYLLDRGTEFSIDRLQGVEATDVVFSNTYRGGFIIPSNAQREHWSSCVRLVRSVPVSRFTRIWSLDRMDDQYSRLLEHVEEQLRRRAA